MSESNFTHFISDLHLTPERPATIEYFLSFLQNQAKEAEATYILGDLFEYWIGDDAAPLLGAGPILEAMKTLSQQMPCFFIAGNRDFLVGDLFAQQSGFTILEDESIVKLYGVDTLVLHGDSLCTEDVAHQQFRTSMVTNQKWREEFLNLGIDARIESAKAARVESQKHKSQISMEIMDVTETAVEDAFRSSGVNQMIHGHTHRQNLHTYVVDDVARSRHVLGDWGKTASIMKVDANGVQIDNPVIG